MSNSKYLILPKTIEMCTRIKRGQKYYCINTGTLEIVINSADYIIENKDDFTNLTELHGCYAVPALGDMKQEIMRLWSALSKDDFKLDIQDNVILISHKSKVYILTNAKTIAPRIGKDRLTIFNKDRLTVLNLYTLCNSTYKGYDDEDILDFCATDLLCCGDLTLNEVKKGIIFGDADKLYSSFKRVYGIEL